MKNCAKGSMFDMGSLINFQINFCFLTRKKKEKKKIYVTHFPRDCKIFLVRVLDL